MPERSLEVDPHTAGSAQKVYNQRDASLARTAWTNLEPGWIEKASPAFFLENVFVYDGCTPKFSIILSASKLETDNT
jgi:hypothetical protein